MYELKDRRVIPNWRDFRRTLQLGELSTSNQKIVPLNISMDRSLLDWSLEQNIGTAADVINASFVSGERTHPGIKEAIDFVNDRKENASQTLFDLIGLISNESITKKPLSISIPLVRPKKLQQGVKLNGS